MTDADRDRLATVAARHWRAHRDYDDLRQAALIALWRAGDQPEHHLLRVGKNAVIDELRRLRGRSDSRAGMRRRGEQLFAVLGDDLHQLVDVDELHPSFTLGLSGRSALLADLLAAGHTKRAIAASLGVTPSAVSHQLDGLRSDVLDALRG